MFKRHALTLSFVFGLLIVPAAHAQGALDTIQKNKTIRIGVPTDLPPFGLPGPDSKPMGLDIDVANLVAAHLGVKAELVPVASGDRVAWLQQRKLDLVVSTLGRNAEREKLIDFTGSYSSFYLVVFAPKALSISTVADLARKSIAVTKSSVEDQELTRTAPADADIQRFPDNSATLAAFAERRTQSMAAGIAAGTAIIAKNPALDAEAKFVLKESQNHIGVPKGEDALRAKVDEALQAARNSGELRKISSKWFSRAGLKQ